MCNCTYSPSPPRSISILSILSDVWDGGAARKRRGGESEGGGFHLRRRRGWRIIYVGFVRRAREDGSEHDWTDDFTSASHFKLSSSIVTGWCFFKFAIMCLMTLSLRLWLRCVVLLFYNLVDKLIILSFGWFIFTFHEIGNNLGGAVRS